MTLITQKVVNGVMSNLAVLDHTKIVGFTSELDKVYAAGFFDGEGHISNRKNKAANGKVYISLHVSIGQSSREVLEWHQKAFEGNIYQYKPGSNKFTKDFWQWSIVGTRAWVFAKQIEPYLKVRKQQLIDAVTAWENRHE